MLINQVCVSIGKSLRRAVAQTPLGTLPNPPPPHSSPFAYLYGVD